MKDTIAAIATATGGGVGIVRLSGADAEGIARALCPTLPSTLASHQLVLTRAFDEGVLLDELLVVVMRAPRSYTGEDVAELHAHGGSANLERLLHAVLRHGARLATPGEFTRRAFLAGKLDLTQAEAVAAVIGARDERTLRAAQAMRQGTLGREVARVRRAVIAELAELEGALDFPDEAGLEDLPGKRVARLRALGRSLGDRAAKFRRALGAVPEVVLMGAVNAGKSSLLNALCGRERALVDAQPGTTRDVVEADVELGDAGIVRMLDTAGLRDTPTELEARGQRIADERRSSAALVLLLVDGQRGMTDGDEALRRRLVAEGKELVVVLSKADLTRDAVGEVRVSAKTGAGLDELRHVLAAKLAVDDDAPSSARQAEALRESAAFIERGIEALLGDHGPVAPEVAAVELRHALAALGRITGETVGEDVLDALFARFCIGK